MSNTSGGIDKFGRWQSRFPGSQTPGPPGLGFSLTDNNSAYDMSKKRLTNLALEPTAQSDAVSFQFFKERCLTLHPSSKFISCQKKRLVSLADPIDNQDGVTKASLNRRIEEADVEIKKLVNSNRESILKCEKILDTVIMDLAKYSLLFLAMEMKHSPTLFLETIKKLDDLYDTIKSHSDIHVRLKLFKREFFKSQFDRNTILRIRDIFNIHEDDIPEEPPPKKIKPDV